MLCCTECFNDEFLKDYIKKQGSLNNCDYCNSTNVETISITELSSNFEPLIHLCHSSFDFYRWGILKNISNPTYYIEDFNNAGWDIFSNENQAHQGRMLKDVFEGIIMPIYEDDVNLVPINEIDELWDGKSGKDAIRREKWEAFKNEFQFKNRFFLKSDSELENIALLLEDMVENLAIGTKVYRARINVEKGKYECGKMGKPEAILATAGRANPQGIPYLYIASDSQTALKEVRPEFGDTISVAEIEIIKELKCIDLREYQIKSPFKFGNKLRQYYDNSMFLEILGQELSKPVNPRDTVFEYLPSQYISEFIKSKGYGGLLYKSSVGAGYNIVIFDEAGKVLCKSTKEYKLKSVDLEFEEI